jgi:hypothetical protein
MVLRKRGSFSAADGADSSAGSSFLKTLQSFDAYAKPLDDFRVKTSTGAAGKSTLPFVFEKNSKGAVDGTFPTCLCVETA